ncbi:hypothetical protein B296_00034708 [Ensete ventricosum]|uniref:Uncharacterized protein n=1 Tax=Ensete ventricosum TaxID=4639 RepID=A0A427A7R4_ENSVE|nr:hypothetical protein B296_00034708 [Ensete ventricosum]
MDRAMYTRGKSWGTQWRTRESINYIVGVRFKTWWVSLPKGSARRIRPANARLVWRYGRYDIGSRWLVPVMTS